MKDKRDIFIKFRVNEEENKLIESKFKLSKCKTKSRFFRLMIFEGFILHFDVEKTKKLLRTFSNISGNINQIALRVNMTGNIYDDDIEEIKKDIEELTKEVFYFTSLLRRLMP